MYTGALGLLYTGPASQIRSRMKKGAYLAENGIDGIRAGEVTLLFFVGAFFLYDSSIPQTFFNFNNHTYSACISSNENLLIPVNFFIIVLTTQ